MLLTDTAMKSLGPENLTKAVLMEKKLFLAWINFTAMATGSRIL